MRRDRFHIALLIPTLLLHGLGASAQQRPQYSQYFTNYFLLNPALAGTADNLDARLGMRLQWVGFTDAPRSFYATANARVGQSRKRYFTKTGKEPRTYHGIGAQILSDVTGPTSRVSAYASYAYNLAVSKTVRVALGGAFGLQQFSLSGADLRFSAGQSTSVVPFSKTFPDANIGLWLYGRRVFLGGSVQQLFRNSFNVNDGQLGAYTAYRHGFVQGGLTFQPNKDWQVTPSFLVETVKPAPLAVDVNVKARYQNKVWGGVSYRHQDAVVVAAGLGLGDYFDFSYSYDIVTSDLVRYQRGTHELMVGFRVSGYRRGYSPTDFWR